MLSGFFGAEITPYNYLLLTFCIIIAVSFVMDAEWDFDSINNEGPVATVIVGVILFIYFVVEYFTIDHRYELVHGTLFLLAMTAWTHFISKSVRYKLEILNNKHGGYSRYKPQDGTAELVGTLLSGLLIVVLAYYFKPGV